jgi:hypothetical protein
MTNNQCDGRKSSWRLNGDLGSWTLINFIITQKLVWPLGEFTPSYILHTCAFGTYLLGGGIYLAENIIRWWYYTCKKPENIICDVILHVNMFHYFKIPYFTCTFSVLCFWPFYDGAIRKSCVGAFIHTTTNLQRWHTSVPIRYHFPLLKENLLIQ